MLTPEQIQNLKPGDIIDIRGFVNLPLNNGNILAELRYEFDNRILPAYQRISTEFISLPSEYGTSVPTPKYDPTRPFKKGDKVQPRSGKTVLASEYGFVTFHELAGQYEVNEDEARGTVTLIVNGHACFVSAFALELVTPVEELVPYSVHEESMHNRWNVIKNKYVHGIHAMFPYKNIGNSDLMSREEAKARASEYSDRLNAEWRKEQSND